MPWSVCKTLLTYVSHSCYNTEVLGFCAFKLTIITIHQSLFLYWNSIPDPFLLYTNQTLPLISCRNKLPFSGQSENTEHFEKWLLPHSIRLTYLTSPQTRIFPSAHHGHFPRWKIVFFVCVCVCEVFQLCHFEIANSQKIKSKKTVNVWNTLFYPLSCHNLCSISVIPLYVTHPPRHKRCFQTNK